MEICYNCLFLSKKLIFIKPYIENKTTVFCALSCTGQVNLSLPETGFVIVTPSMMSSVSNCSEILEVHIMDTNGIDIGNTVDCNYAGQTLMVSIVHPASGNNCWGSILVEDKLEPTINCIDIEIGCNEDTSPVNTGIPIVSDNCLALPNPTYFDTLENFDCTNPQFKAVIKRTWTVTDTNGNTNSCEQNIFIKNLDISQVIFPPTFTVDCNNINLDPSFTGEPMVNGISIGNKLTKEEIEKVKETVKANPRKYIAQPIMALSTHPTYIEESGSFEPRHVDLRTFTLLGKDKDFVLKGGLSRVALRKGNLVVNSSQGGGSKDTWVLKK